MYSSTSSLITAQDEAMMYIQVQDVEVPVAVRVLEIRSRHQDVWIELSLIVADRQVAAPVVVPPSQIGEFVMLPLRYCDLTPCAEVRLALVNYSATLASAVLPLFNAHGKLRTGAARVLLEPLGSERPGGKIAGDVLVRLDQRLHKYHSGELPSVEWMDVHSSPAIERFVREVRAADSPASLAMSGGASHLSAAAATGDADGSARVYVEMPRFPCRVLFVDPQAADEAHLPLVVPRPVVAPDDVASESAPDLARAVLGRRGASAMVVSRMVDADVRLFDPEISRANPVEEMESVRPSVRQRKLLQRIIDYPPSQQLTPEERALLWRYSNFLRTHIPTALPKLLRAVDWSNQKAQIRAEIILKAWTPIDVDAALELLSGAFRGIAPVRAYAVQILGSASDDELLAYLLPLVQALRYGRAFRDGARPAATAAAAPPTTDDGTFIDGASGWDSGGDPLVDFLISRASANARLANFLFWYLTVETEDRGYGAAFRRTLEAFRKVLGGSPRGAGLLKSFALQEDFVRSLVTVHQAIMKMNRSHDRKVAALQEMLERFRRFETPFSLPLDPDLTVVGVVADQAYVFGSALQPFKVPFLLDNGDVYNTMFKCGDDLRQDQMILQMFRLMDRLLRKESLDLKLTAYAVLATSTETGFLQFIPSVTLRNVLQSYEKRNPIQDFLRQKSPDPNDPVTGIKPDTLDAFLRSNAGFCVLTYLLGIGDRHNDNILLRDDGRLFHVDFGFILGHEPPLKGKGVPFKLTKKMAVAMAFNEENWATSRFYLAFKTYACESFNILRSNANLILNLFVLMVDANIQDIARLGPERSLKEVQRKFELGLSNEEAIQVLQELIESSIRSIWRDFMDDIHDRKMSLFQRN